jgi:type I restriction enzyme S subunit
MRSSYKKLGEYIQVVNNRNSDLQVERLLGVSIKKILMPSIANTVGTNMSTYKIIKRNQFAYGPVTSRNGNKISVALLEEFDEAIVSQAYMVFKITDHQLLDPEYLMMWFRRPEFDRYARFKSHGSASPGSQTYRNKLIKLDLLYEEKKVQAFDAIGTHQD